MRPNWITIAIAPAFCGALVGLGVAEALLRYPTPLPTLSSEARNNLAKKGEAPPTTSSPNAETGGQQTKAVTPLAALALLRPLRAIKPTRTPLRGGLSSSTAWLGRSPYS
jgi:hypothetical protein